MSSLLVFNILEDVNVLCSSTKDIFEYKGPLDTGKNNLS